MSRLGISAPGSTAARSATTSSASARSGTASPILITITAILGLAVRGLNMGIEFQGGAVFTTAEAPASR